MKKPIYISPVMEIIEIELEQGIAASPTPQISDLQPDDTEYL